MPDVDATVQGMRQLLEFMERGVASFWDALDDRDREIVGRMAEATTEHVMPIAKQAKQGVHVVNYFGMEVCRAAIQAAIEVIEKKQASDDQRT